jgi:hypothetical protein
MEHVRQALGWEPEYHQKGYASERDWIEAQVKEAMGLLKTRAVRPLYEDDEDIYTRIRRTIMDSAYSASDAKDFLKRHRSLQRFWETTASKVSTYKERREIVDSAFELTLQRLDGTAEASVLIDLDDDTLHALDMAEVTRLWDKATKRLDSGDVDGALTLSKTLLETTCKRILAIFGQPHSGADRTQELFKRSLALVLPPSAKGQEHFKHLTRSSLNIVEQIARYRNEQSDAHGSATTKTLEAHEAAYALNLAGSSTQFLIQCYNSAKEVE